MDDTIFLVKGSPWVTAGSFNERFSEEYDGGTTPAEEEEAIASNRLHKWDMDAEEEVPVPVDNDDATAVCALAARVPLSTNAPKRFSTAYHFENVS